MNGWSAIGPQPGDEAQLEPRTLGCARECWDRPAVTVVEVGIVNITVRLGDGTEITTHRDNVARRTTRSPRSTTKTQEQPMTGGEEVALW